MFRVGSTNGGGATGDYFWQFVGGGAGPGNIDIKSANGVTGINAQLPVDTDVKIVLEDDGTQKKAAHALFNGTDLFGVGAFKEAGRRSVDMFWTDLLTKIKGFAVEDTVITIAATDASDGYGFNIDEISAEEVIVDTGTLSFIKRLVNKFAFQNEIRDVPGAKHYQEDINATSKSSTFESAANTSVAAQAASYKNATVTSATAVSVTEQQADQVFIKVTTAGIGQEQNFNFQQDNFNYADQANGLLFKVDRTGKIYTNQVKPLLGGVPLIIGRIEIRDSAGTWLGNLPLYDTTL